MFFSVPGASVERTRREALRGLAALSGAFALGVSPVRARAADAGFRLATFAADVTIPLGHACMGGGVAPARTIVDPLEARGTVLLGAGKPLVVAVVDWCEIRNDAYDRWRNVLAEAAGTDPKRVLVSSVHQHDAPVADLRAERILRDHHAAGSVCDPEFHERAVQKTAEALRKGLSRARAVTHLGVGKAKVKKVASNRRYLLADGRPAFGRTSATRDVYARSQPEGTIDPWLRALSFWDGDRPLAVLNVYATHPMSYYGQGEVSADFMGMARRDRQKDEPGVFQIYGSGCSGNVTAGKFNDGSRAKRAALAGRMRDAMKRAWNDTRKVPLGRAEFRVVPLKLKPRDRPESFTVAGLEHRLTHDPKPFGQCLAALGLSWRERADAGRAIDLPVIDFGGAVLALLPGESYVEYQLLAQSLRPESFVVVLGYGECATGYVPTEKAFEERDGNLNDWCWVAPSGAEPTMTAALRAALGRRDQ